MSNAIELSTATFDQVLQSDKPYLVDFWAAWCGPCRALGPVIEELAGEKDQLNINVGKLNVDENREIALRYNVMSIPTVLLFKDGDVVCTSVGSVPKAELLSRIAPFI